MSPLIGTLRTVTKLLMPNSKCRNTLDSELKGVHQFGLNRPLTLLTNVLFGLGAFVRRIFVYLFYGLNQLAER